MKISLRRSPQHWCPREESKSELFAHDNDALTARQQLHLSSVSWTLPLNCLMSCTLRFLRGYIPRNILAIPHLLFPVTLVYSKLCLKISLSHYISYLLQWKQDVNQLPKTCHRSHFLLYLFILEDKRSCKRVGTITWYSFNTCLFYILLV